MNEVPYSTRTGIRVLVRRFLYEFLYEYEYGSWYYSSTRLGSCTGDLRSCANVPSMGDPTLFLNVVLCLF